LPYRHAREFLAWFLQETLRAPQGGWEARALLGLCDRYYPLTEIIGRADMLWHGDPGESVPAGNVRLYGANPSTVGAAARQPRKPLPRTGPSDIAAVAQGRAPGGGDRQPDLADASSTPTAASATGLSCTTSQLRRGAVV
jgi:hypothetical protein